MPKVGTKKFPYTSAGSHQAQMHARQTGQKVTMKNGGKVKKKNKKNKKRR